VTDTDAPEAKQVTGYCEPWSLRAGEPIRLMASSHQPGPAQVDITQIVCGDPTRYGPGFDERSVSAAGSWSVDLDEQPLTPGSYGVASLDGLPGGGRVALQAWVMPTLPDRPARIATLTARLAAAPQASASIDILRIELDGGRAVAVSSAPRPQTRVVIDDVPLTRNRWYLIAADLDLETATLSAVLVTPPSDSPGRDAVEADRLSDRSASDLSSGWAFHADHGVRAATTLGSTARAQEFAVDELWLAAGRGGERFDGRIARPMLQYGEATARWDLSTDMAGRTVPASEGAAGPLVLHQLPTRGITGPAWDGSAHRWSDNPAHYDAVHFHHDDQYDAGWETTVEATLPEDLPSGIYAFRVRGDAGDDRVPFFVRPAVGTRAADVALLMPTATYMAYANHRMLIDGADFMSTRTKLRPEHAYVRDHPELGLSHYEKHPDHSGVMFSSRLRPVLNLRPGADGWNFTPDTDINAFLEHLEVGHDIVTDEDLHVDGLAAIAPYRVLVTGSHPEYWSTAMLDALADWQRDGGRLMYLGGNGFYWRVAFSDAWPGAIGLRRAEDGVRNGQTGPGESYHAGGGEYGGCGAARGGRPTRSAASGSRLRASRRPRISSVIRERTARGPHGFSKGYPPSASARPGWAAAQPVRRWTATTYGSDHQATLWCWPRRRRSVPTCCARRKSSKAQCSSRHPTPWCAPTWCSTRRRTAGRCSRSVPSRGSAHWPETATTTMWRASRPTWCDASPIRSPSRRRLLDRARRPVSSLCALRR